MFVLNWILYSVSYSLLPCFNFFVLTDQYFAPKMNRISASSDLFISIFYFDKFVSEKNLEII